MTTNMAINHKCSNILCIFNVLCKTKESVMLHHPRVIVAAAAAAAAIQSQQFHGCSFAPAARLANRAATSSPRSLTSMRGGGLPHTKSAPAW